jgi:hypothetical protein
MTSAGIVPEDGVKNKPGERVIRRNRVSTVKRLIPSEWQKPGF